MSSPKQKFTDAFQRLERIVTELESKDIDLEDALKKYAEGLALAKLCKERLEQAENRVREIKARFEEKTEEE